MEKKLYDAVGNEAGNLTVSGSLFTQEVKKFLIYEKIKNELANQRLGTACTKTKGEVRGGGKKPWKQKGTGRARSGSTRSPIWVGGGIVFGPRPRDYGYQLNKKMKKLALVHTLAYKLQDSECVKIVKDFTIESAKTKDAYALIKKVNQNKEERTLVIFNNEDANLKRALRNIPWVKYMSADRLAAHEMFYAKHIIIMEGALKKIEEKYGAFAQSN
ncbi:MAG: 50S ribosomal protein L4 [Spirochaetes bacterium GWB1_36_13]|nr:MAG: 50S ribosomal protein L4 [Spirochaetes bacterium GWB1_36_13]